MGKRVIKGWTSVGFEPTGKSPGVGRFFKERAASKCLGLLNILFSCGLIIIAV